MITQSKNKKTNGKQTLHLNFLKPTFLKPNIRQKNVFSLLILASSRNTLVRENTFLKE